MQIKFFNKAEVTEQLLEERVKHAQQDKTDRKPRWHIARPTLSLSNIHHIPFPSLFHSSFNSNKYISG